MSVAQVLLATSLRRVPLAWARDCVAQTSPWSPRRESWTRTQCETLQLSLRRDGPAWARLAGFRVCIRMHITKTIPKHQIIITNTTQWPKCIRIVL